KRRAGAEVTVVFLTDGSGSHPALMSAANMSRLRAAEARAACEVLGVPSEHVHFLGFPDGHLTEHLDEAVPRVVELLKRLRPAEVFVPHYYDGPPDHLATTNAVLSALRISGWPAIVYEYPVWLWCQWPWVRLTGNLREVVHCLQQSKEANQRLLRECRWTVDVSDVLDLKRAALAEHKSQVEQLVPDPRWTTLGNIFHGEFLPCFFREKEIFYRHSPPEPDGERPA
ncbi:MAG TPA: PIG-L deacetylase family protein, partial [Gemmataceae bacterium]|nr:PIG-L deacetylase family protein [Gemmataceae bacterium]